MENSCVIPNTFHLSQSQGNFYVLHKKVYQDITKCFIDDNLYFDHTSYRFKLEVLASDGKLKYKFVFWDVDCVKLIGKSALQMKLDLMKV